MYGCTLEMSIFQAALFLPIILNNKFWVFQPSKPVIIKTRSCSICTLFTRFDISKPGNLDLCKCRAKRGFLGGFFLN
jgi:hypothetical protein